MNQKEHKTLAEIMEGIVKAFNPVMEKIAQGINEIVESDFMKIMIRKRYFATDICKMVNEYVHSDELMEELSEKEYAQLHDAIMNFQKFVISKALDDHQA